MQEKGYGCLILSLGYEQLFFDTPAGTAQRGRHILVGDQEVIDVISRLETVEILETTLQRSQHGI